MKIGVVSGGFDPIHSGHLKYINSARKNCDFLVVLLNSDDWLIRKKGNNFLPFEERRIILKNLSGVDQVLSFNDDNAMSARHGLHKIKKIYPNDQIIFFNGGDRNKSNIPEMEVEGIQFKFNTGGSKKINSSSTILSSWSGKKIIRSWGYYKVLQSNPKTKLKELSISKFSGLSFQKHNYRSELWFVVEGSCELITSKTKNSSKQSVYLQANDSFLIKKGQWHQAINHNKIPCKIYEIQFGEKVIEEDIERLFYYNHTT